MTKGTLTLKKLNDLVAKIPETDEKTWFVVNPKIKKLFDKAWNKFPWYLKLWINIKRLFNGVGFYE